MVNGKEEVSQSSSAQIAKETWLSTQKGEKE